MRADAARAPPDRWISTPHLAPDHRGPIELPLISFPDPAHAPPIADLLRHAVEQHPDRTAFEYAGLGLTFTELWSAVQRLAGAIAGHGGSSPVGILLPAGIHYPVAVFACLVAGRISLLLDAHYPPTRNREIASEAGAGLIVAEASVRRSDWPGVELITPDADAAASADGAPFDPDAVAFLMSTSGSAGRPKLIAHSQRTMLHWVRTLIHAMHVAPSDRVLSVSSPSSLGGFTSLLTFPLAGSASQMFEIKEAGLGGLIQTLAERPVTILRAAPPLLRALAQHPRLARPAMAGLRIVQTYGEPLLKGDVAAIRPLLPACCRIRTTYGSTEGSGLSWFAGDPDEHDPVRVATGVLMPDTRALIVDEQDRACGPGREGELIVASRYNALGEWRNGAMVPGALEPDPEEPRVRLFRTGDVARCSSEGVFVVVGRKDRMAKINAQRVEPAEVEAAMRALPGVERAEIVIERFTARDRLVAFVVAAPDAGADLTDDLRRALETRLPGFMVPSRIVVVDSIPLLAGGKVDSTALLDRLRADEC